MALIFGAPDITVYAEDQMVQIVCLPPDGTIVERCDKASRIILTIKEAKGLIFTLRDAVRIIREGG